MRRTPNRPLRFAVFALVLAVAASLAACGKDDKVVNPAPTGAITWNNSIRHLIADRSEGTAPTGCTSCHHTGTTITYFDGGSATIKEADWTQYANVYADRNTLRSYVGPGGPMRRFLRPNEPEVIIDWIDAGAPEN
jgi:hypothetical protein